MNISEIPHRWLVVKLTNEETFYKLFGSWMGGYLDGDRWKMNSGIVKVEEDDEHYYFYGHSGSVYKCHKKGYGSTSYTQSVLDGIISHGKEKKNTIVEILPEDTNWMKLLDL